MPFAPFIVFVVLEIFAGSLQQNALGQTNRNWPIQGYNLMGWPLRSPEPSEEVSSRYENALDDFWNDPNDPMKTIWLGRFEAYRGRYDLAIERFSEGIDRFPDDPRFYRHRGHRFITIRRLDLAILDFKKAVELVEGTPDRVEPDGMPNSKNIPVSTLQTNIWYHLGLAYFLSGQYEEAAEAYESGLKLCKNDDMRVAFIHWYYMTLRILNRREAAEEVLAPIEEDMNVIESFDYQSLCLLYKGLKTLDELDDTTTPGTPGSSEALQFGIANWHLYEENDERSARPILEKLIRSKNWSAFGCIAAESIYLERFGRLSK